MAQFSWVISQLPGGRLITLDYFYHGKHLLEYRLGKNIWFREQSLLWGSVLKVKLSFVLRGDTFRERFCFTPSASCHRSVQGRFSP